MRLAMVPLLLLALTACPAQDAQDQATIETKAPAFSADSAYELLRAQVAFGPRVPGTPGHAQQLAWMQERLRPLADTVIEQRFTHTTDMGTELQLANVFARFNTASPDRVLLVAHWDTRPTADEDVESKRGEPIPGANDGASGVALLMQMAAVFKKNPPPIGVDILLVDGEDYAPNNMYLGAKYFAANLPAGYRPLYGILVDMIADQNPIYPVESNSQRFAPEVVERVWRTAEQMGLSSYFRRQEGGGIEDDHVPLNAAGIRTIDIIDFDYPHWHKTTDALENTAPKGLEVVGRVLLELIYRGG